jgi:phage host-nuclease inhibitor protein Gam
MTRTRVETPAISSWDDADQALRRYGELQIAGERIVGNTDLAINKMKARRELRLTALQEEMRLLELQLQQFTLARPDDLKKAGRKKSRLLVFGQLGIRWSTKVEKTLKDDQIVARLKALDLTECIRTKEEPKLSEIKKLDAKLIKQVGCSVKEGDTFFLEPDRQKIIAEASK